MRFLLIKLYEFLVFLCVAAVVLSLTAWLTGIISFRLNGYTLDLITTQRVERLYEALRACSTTITRSF